MKTKNLSKSSNVSFNPCTQRMENAGEEIVISGFTGRFPESDNLKIFQENLFNKKNLITKDHRRWDLGKLIFNYYYLITRKYYRMSIYNTILKLTDVQKFLIFFH